MYQRPEGTGILEWTCLSMVVKQKSETKVKEEREISPIDRDICQWEGDFLNYNRRYAIVSGEELQSKVGFRYFLLVLNLTRKINPLVINTVRVTSNINITPFV